MSFIHPVLTLRVTSYHDEPLAEPITVVFGPDGGTIGRATTCTLVLPDQQRAISRVHARVEYRAGEYLLCDLGSNPSVLNQRALGGTREARLAAGDQLMIGAYLLDVAVGEAAAPAGERPFAGDPLARVSVLAGAPFGDPLNLPAGGPLGGDARSPGGLDALGQASFGAGERISTRPGFAGSESDHVAPEWQAFAPPTLVPPVGMPGLGGGSAMPPMPPASGGIPADYDPLADALAQWDAAGGAGAAGPAAGAPVGGFSPPPPLQHAAAGISSTSNASGSAAPSGGPTGLPASLLGDPVSGGGATPFDDLFAPAPASDAGVMPSLGEPLPVDQVPQEPDFSPPVVQAPPPPVVQAPPPPVVQAPPPVVQTPLPPVAEEIPQASAPPPPVATPTPAAKPSAAAAPRPTPSTATDPILAALLEGLGVDPSRASGLAPDDLARIAGAMLREALRGTMAVLRARMMTKREARLDTTLIVERDNNPLKFFPDIDSALVQMLSGRGGGYLPPAEAVARAFVDIESHELAVLAGMRAALAQVLARFDPASLEAQLASGGALDRVLSNRKAKLWDRFVALQGEVSRDAQDDFQKLFGKAFNEAYEAQVDALQRAHRGGRPDPT